MGRNGGQHRFAAAPRTPTGTFRLEPLESRRLLSSITLVKPSADAYSVFEELLVSSDGQQAFFTMDDALWAADQSSVVKVGSISSAADLTLHGRWLYSRDLLGRLNLTDINTRQTWLISLPRAGVQVEQIFSLSNAVVVYGSDPADDFAPYFFIKRDSDAGFRTIANSGADVAQDFPLVFELNGQPHLLVGGDIKRIDFASDGSASATTIAQVQLLTGAATQVLSIGGALYINDGGWLRTKAVPGDAIGYSFVNPPLDFLGTAWFAEGQALYRVNPATGQAQPVVPFSPGVQQAVVSGNRIFILTPDGQVWMSNGTASGTVPVTALNGLRPTTLIPAPDGRVVVVAWNAARGNEFWLSDGTSGGTSIFDVSPGPADSSLGSFAFAGSNRIFFLADSTRGSGLFRADVTPGVNRAPVVAFKTSPRVLEGRTLTLDASATIDPDGDSLLFMWDLNGDGDFNDVVSTSPIVAVGWGRLCQLGISDGPATFSARVRAFDASAAGLSPLTPLSVLDAPPRVILSVPRQLLPNTDWTASFRFSDYGADTISSFVIDWGDGVLTRRRGSRATLTHRYSSTGTFSMRLVTTDEDGTRSSPAILITVVPRLTGPTLIGSNVGEHFAELPSGQIVYCAGNNGSDQGLWVSDGTSYGARLLLGNLEIYRMLRIGSLVYFLADGVQDATPGVHLYRTDGTAAGTFTLPAPGGIDASSFFEFNGRAVFVAADVNGANLRLMISDGTVPGTRIVPTTTSLYPLALSDATRFGDSVYFVAARDNTSLGNYLYRFDGTRLLPVMRLFSGPGVATLYTAGQWLFIHRSGLGQDATEDGTLWRSDGTAAGTVRVRQADSDVDPRFDVCFAGASTLLAVAPTDPGNSDDLELWAVDADGVARLLHDIRPGPAGSDISFLANAGPYTYFTADDGTNGRELWRTDGTTAGTRIVRDLASGGASIQILSYSVANNRLYFTVADGRGGSALYRTDGTYSRTLRLTPATAAALGMEVRSLTPMGDRLLFIYRASSSSAWDWWIADASSTAAAELTILSVPPTAAGGAVTLIGQNLYLSSGAGGSTNSNELWRIYRDA